MNPPLPVTQILSFFSGQYGSNGNFASSEATMVSLSVVITLHYFLFSSTAVSVVAINRGMRREEDSKNDDWLTTQ